MQAAAELAQHWASAGRPVEALEASLLAAREAEAVSGLTEALHHVERVLELWDDVPGAEQLTGVALPALLAWAAELAGLSVQRTDEVDARRLVGILGPDQSLDVDAVAIRLGVSREAATATLETLVQDGLVERVADGVFRSVPLAVAEARRLYPSVVVLESLAVRQSARVRRRRTRRPPVGQRASARCPGRPRGGDCRGRRLPPGAHRRAAGTSICWPRCGRFDARFCATSASTCWIRRGSSAPSRSTT